jgi:hypothetical protein
VIASGARGGSYVSPLLPGYREFDKNQIAFRILPIGMMRHYHDSLDKMSTNPVKYDRNDKLKKLQNL